MAHHEPAPTRLQLQTPLDVIAAVPYLLGFHPEDSIVVLGLRDNALVFHARSDLPDAGTASDSHRNAAEHLASVLRAQRIASVITLGYGASRRVTPLVVALTDAVAAAGIQIVDQLRIHGGRFWSYRCQNPTCCPPEGMPYDITTTGVAAEATLAGCVAFPSRADIVRTFGPPTGEALAAVRSITDRVRDEIASGASTEAGRAGTTIASLIDRHRRGASPTDEDVARLAVLLHVEQAAREQALAGIEAEAPAPSPSTAWGAERATPQTEFWTSIVQRCDPRYVVAPAVFLAYACWRAGDGVRAGIAIDRALAVDPDCAAARIVEDLLYRAVPPPRVREPDADGYGPRRDRPLRRP